MKSKKPYFIEEKKETRSKKFFILGVLLFAILIIIGIYYFVYRENKSDIDKLPVAGEENTELERITKDLNYFPGANNAVKLARIDKEFIFYEDLYYYAILQNKEVKDLDYQKSLNELIAQSILLQAGESEGWIELSSEIFNNPFKDFSLRGQKVIEVREKFRSEVEIGTVVEIITVWFYNGELRSYALNYGIEAAQEKASEKISEVYKAVTDNNQSMEEAASLIVNDVFFEELDVNYKGNAYGVRIFPYRIENIKDVDESSENLFNFLKVANEGEVSQIYLEKNKLFDSEDFVDAYYVFYKVKSKRMSVSSIEEWIENIKKDIKIEIYVNNKDEL